MTNLSEFADAKSRAEGKRQTAHQEALEAFHKNISEEADYQIARFALDAATRRADRNYYQELARLGSIHDVSTGYNPQR
jgi:hypothetical protein